MHPDSTSSCTYIVRIICMRVPLCPPRCLARQELMGGRQERSIRSIVERGSTYIRSLSTSKPAARLSKTKSRGWKQPRKSTPYKAKAEGPRFCFSIACFLFYALHLPATKGGRESKRAVCLFGSFLYKKSQAAPAGCPTPMVLLGPCLLYTPRERHEGGRAHTSSWASSS